MNKQKLKEQLKHNVLPKTFTNKELQSSISNTQNSLYYCYSLEVFNYLINRGITTDFEALKAHYEKAYIDTQSLDYKRIFDYIGEYMDLEEDVKQHVPP